MNMATIINTIIPHPKLQAVRVWRTGDGQRLSSFQLRGGELTYTEGEGGQQSAAENSDGAKVAILRGSSSNAGEVGDGTEIPFLRRQEGAVRSTGEERLFDETDHWLLADAVEKNVQ